MILSAILHRIHKKISAVVDYLNFHCRELKLVMLKNFRSVITGRPAGPVRSDLFGPVPVPVIKNPDRSHLCFIQSLFLYIQENFF